MSKLYRISQDIFGGYDTYSDAVVCAFDEERARQIHPDGGVNREERERPSYSTWANPSDVRVEYLGELSEDSKYMPGDVICASFHAG